MLKDCATVLGGVKGQGAERDGERGNPTVQSCTMANNNSSSNSGQNNKHKNKSLKIIFLKVKAETCRFSFIVVHTCSSCFRFYLIAVILCLHLKHPDFDLIFVILIYLEIFSVSSWLPAVSSVLFSELITCSQSQVTRGHAFFTNASLVIGFL